MEMHTSKTMLLVCYFKDMLIYRKVYLYFCMQELLLEWQASDSKPWLNLEEELCVWWAGVNEALFTIFTHSVVPLEFYTLHLCEIEEYISMF